MTAPTCGSCRWWHVRANTGKTRGDCRRGAPVYVNYHGARDRDWPNTENTDWCGEHTNVRSTSAVEHSTPKGEG